MRVRFPMALLCSLTFAWCTGKASAQSGAVEFNRDVRPILSNVCFQCHGPDENQLQAELRLDRKEGLFRRGEETTVVVPGKPEASELYRRISTADPDEKMPPPDSGAKLLPEQIETIRSWIAQGAGWQGHWAYVKPTRPQLPDITQPDFVRNAIDRFVLARLQEQQLSPSPEADRVTLIRRLSFDLTGLPPTPQQVADFVNDQSPGAYEALVDRLLDSPHYGERMALAWLDLVRYADTNGIHGDNHRDVSLFRDYVIEAFNTNMPFDQFTIEQLAGDLLPERTEAQWIASGYNRLLMTTREGGAQGKEYLAKYAADRVRNASSVWMAATLGCAECHNHKFDPFTTRDFYSFAAFFADIQEVAVGQQPPTKFPTPEQKRQLAELDARIADVKQVLDTQTAELDAAISKWEASLESRQVEWSPLELTQTASAQGATLTVQEDGSVLSSGENPGQDAYTITVRTSLEKITGVRLEVLPHDSLPQKGPGRAANGNFVLNEIEFTEGDQPVSWSAASATHSQANWDVAGAIDRKAQTGWAILDHAGRENSAVFETKTDVAAGDESRLTITLRFGYGSAHTIGCFRLSATAAERPVRVDGANGVPDNIRQILAVEADQRSDQQRRELAAYFRSIAPELEPVRNELAALESQRKAIDAAIPTTLVSVSGNPREMRVLPRGNWLDDSGPVVAPAVPASLSGLDVADRRPTRLDLARWFVSADNPLTARVMVNRLWKMMMGQGLVRSMDDFGAQGSWPSHPKLLDWLAVEFVESGWDVKHMLRLMAASATYRQTSQADPELRRRDPYNTWLARQNRYRLDAETVRDNALAVSGLLVRKIGGRSVKPYQPAGYWAHLNFPPRTYQHDSGEEQYRRGLYTYWCRTFLHPSLLAFDAPTREECTVERPRSNTPLQALVLLNDPTYVEAARALAERILREGGLDADSRLRFAFREALSREPRPEELEVLSSLAERHQREFAENEKAAEFLSVGLRAAPQDLSPAELAAWTSVARVILNLHETMTRY